jgi:hypothetical protein
MLQVKIREAVHQMQVEIEEEVVAEVVVIAEMTVAEEATDHKVATVVAIAVEEENNLLTI